MNGQPAFFPSPWSCVLLNILVGKRELPETAYARGFIDAYLGRDYNDGIRCPHRFQVCVPSDDPYRVGWLEGLWCRNMVRE